MALETSIPHLLEIALVAAVEDNLGAVEMIDRFSLFPPALKNLFALSELKLKLIGLGIKKLEANGKGGKMEFTDRPRLDPKHLIHLIQTQSQRFRFDGATKLRFTLVEHTQAERIALVESLIGELVGT